MSSTATTAGVIATLVDEGYTREDVQAAVDSFIGADHRCLAFDEEQLDEGCVAWEADDVDVVREQLAGAATATVAVERLFESSPFASDQWVCVEVLGSWPRHEVHRHTLHPHSVILDSRYRRSDLRAGMYRLTSTASDGELVYASAPMTLVDPTVEQEAVAAAAAQAGCLVRPRGERLAIYHPDMPGYLVSVGVDEDETGWSWTLWSVVEGDEVEMAITTDGTAAADPTPELASWLTTWSKDARPAPGVGDLVRVLPNAQMRLGSELRPSGMIAGALAVVVTNPLAGDLDLLVAEVEVTNGGHLTWYVTPESVEVLVSQAEHRRQAGR